MMRQYELVEKVAAYDSHLDEDLLNRAYVFTVQAHGTQKRASGDPYFSHPVEVAGILTDYRLDTTTIITALLHDTVEDTVATLPQIQDRFGPEVAKLVDGVTKLSTLELRSEQSKQAENFRKLLLAMSSDIRVLLVKLADRLHNMRTLQFLTKPERRRRIAAETMEIYAPLAERIGMQRIKDELEDLAFAELYPEARESVIARLQFLREKSGDLIPLITDELSARLREAGIEATVGGREKRPHSIWRKMQKYNVGFEQLSDIVAFRILVDDPMQCYQALGVVHQHYATVPGRFKDYISTPKRNKYRSLHTTVIGPQQQRVEVQIRTHDMNEIAEDGVAAHWTYKQHVASTEGEGYRWLHELLEILERADSPEEFLEHTKLEMFRDQVFCFTPSGEVIDLPRGATPVDFAYAVHTAVGDSCVGAKVNGRVMPLRTELHNGDQVEVLRAKESGPNPNWESFVVTGRARSAIRRFVRHQEREEYQRLGRAMAEKAFVGSGHEFTEKAIEQAAKVMRLRSADDVYVDLGRGQVTPRELLAKIFPGERWRPKDAIDAINRVLPARLRRRRKTEMAVPIQGLRPGLAVHFGDCCHPLPGDRIVGIMSKGEGVTVHTIDCERLAELDDSSERWIDVSWDVEVEAGAGHVGRLKAVLANEPGSLSSLSTVIAKNLGNIFNLTFTNRGPDFFEAQVDIEVEDVKHLTNIIAALRATPQVNSVERLRG
ncbi:MAG: bifunctional (p)ppGpp synthetase/guanosine-3',5'-bis(diphosphate) 3'-pyrophosphohydrolase [Alphaproteobacteria bacterium]